jgi:hypothetical protein
MSFIEWPEQLLATASVAEWWEVFDKMNRTIQPDFGQSRTKTVKLNFKDGPVIAKLKVWWDWGGKGKNPTKVALLDEDEEMIAWVDRNVGRFERIGQFDRQKCDGQRHPLTHMNGLANCRGTSGYLWRARHMPHPDNPDIPMFIWENVGRTKSWGVSDEELAAACELYHFFNQRGGCPEGLT